MDRLLLLTYFAITGTSCLNESLSSQLDGRLPWSYSTSFYPGESTFSSIYDDHVLKHVGLNKENGGKFQVLPVATIVTALKSFL